MLNEEEKEECSELIHAVCKAKKFGYMNYHPFEDAKKLNISRILDEMDDVERSLKDYRNYLALHFKELV